MVYSGYAIEIQVIGIVQCDQIVLSCRSLDELKIVSISFHAAFLSAHFLQWCTRHEFVRLQIVSATQLQHLQYSFVSFRSSPAEKKTLFQLILSLFLSIIPEYGAYAVRTPCLYK